MEQRRLRLGDIVDDYCPRERRVTNHAIVAMVEDDIKQTRCTTCDAEHAYKGARVPARRRKEPVAVRPAGPASIESLTAAAPTPGDSGVDSQFSMHNDDTGPILRMPQHETPADLPALSSEPPSPEPSQGRALEAPLDDVDEAPAVDGPVHRPLIRATLPRPDGQKDVRPVPEFTVRHSTGRGPGQGRGNGHFRGDRMRTRSGNGHGSPNGNRAPNAGPRFQGSGNRPSGSGRPSGRGGAGFRGGSGSKRGRGSRG